MSVELMEIEPLFDLEPYNGSKLEALEKATSPGHVAKRIAVHEPAKLAKITSSAAQALTSSSAKKATTP